MIELLLDCNKIKWLVGKCKKKKKKPESENQKINVSYLFMLNVLSFCFNFYRVSWSFP